MRPLQFLLLLLLLPGFVLAQGQGPSYEYGLELTARGSYDSALAHFGTALQRARTQADSQSVARAANDLGVVYARQGAYGKALHSFQVALSAVQKVRDPLETIKAYNNMGVVYLDQGDYPQSTEYHLKALGLAREHKNLIAAASAETNLGNVGFRQEDWPQARIHYQKALEYRTQAGDSLRLATAYNNMGLVSLRQDSMQLARRWYQRSLDLARRNADPAGEARAAGNLGIVFRRMGQADTALVWYRRGLQIEDSLGLRRDAAASRLNMGLLLEARGEHEDALSQFNQAFDIAWDIGARDLSMRIARQLSRAYEDDGIYNIALEYHKLYAELQDSLFNEESQQAIARLQAGFELQQAESEIEVKNEQIRRQQRNFILLILGLCVLLGMLGLLYNRERARKSLQAKARKLETEKLLAEYEQQALRAQMNPHFLFNSLTSIGGYIYQNDAASAQKYLGKFAKLMRLVLDHSSRPWISLDKEMEALRYYIELEQARAGHRFDFEIVSPPGLDRTALIPPMILQPFVENAILHGLFPKPDSGHLYLALTSKGSQLQVVIRDNGIGREAAAARKSQDPDASPSRGMEITQRRLELLGHTDTTGLQIKVVDLRDAAGQAAGTEVRLRIEMKVEE